MPNYQYKAVDAKGAVVNGSCGATTLEALTDILKGQGLFLMEGKVLQTETTAAPVSVGGLEPAAKRSDAVALKDVSIFTTEFSIMVRTALPILESLDNLARQQGDPTFKAVLKEIQRSVREGQRLSEAFSRYPNIFNEVYISLLAAGEAGGSLPMMLDRISLYLNFQRALKAKVRSALLYPCIVVLVSVAVVAFLVLYILPTFAEVFSQFEVKLPLPTRLLMAMSGNIRSWWLAYLACGMTVWGYVARWFSAKANSRRVDTFWLNLPLAGTLARNIIMTRVLRTLSALVASGVPILKSLDLSRASAGNQVFDELLGKVSAAASQGRGLASAFAESPYFPQQVSSMIANAERSGSLPEVLLKVADFYEAETDTALKDFFAVMEPLFVVFLGLMVGFIAISILMPIFQLGSSIQ